VGGREGGVKKEGKRKLGCVSRSREDHPKKSEVLLSEEREDPETLER